MTEIDTRTVDIYQSAYADLQQRFNGQIEVVNANHDTGYQDPNQLAAGVDAVGFRDISAKVSELGPFIGRIVLYPNRRKNEYQPAVITRKGASLQMTVLNQPFDPNVGISDGILFELGLKNDTNQPTFGTHTASGGFEAGHFAPAMIGVRAADARNAIISRGDRGTHGVGSSAGGVPEKMMQEGLLGGVAMTTRALPADSPHPVPLYWHPRLEDNRGLMVANYEGQTNAVQLMLGAASYALGPRAVDQIGELADAAIRTGN